MKNKSLCFFFVAFALSLQAQNTTVTNSGKLFIQPGAKVSVQSNFVNNSSGDLFNDGELTFFGDVTNNGLFTRTTNAQTGYVVFSSNLPKAQQILGESPISFYKVLFNKTQGEKKFVISNKEGIDVAHLADFAQGVVFVDKANESSVTFLKGATAKASANGFVSGQVTKIGNDEFRFPIGKDNFYRFASISAPEKDADAYSGEYFYEDTNVKFPHKNRTGVVKAIDSKEYWVINKTKGAKESSVLITLSWDEKTTPAELLTNEGKDLVVLRWNDKDKLWIQEGGVIDSENKTVTTLLKVDDFGVFTLGKVDSKHINDGGVVAYTSVSADNDGINDYFYIEKINHFPENKVSVFNRWGQEVYSTTAYDTKGNVFNGYGNGNFSGKKMNAGTYYYILEYMITDKSGQSRMVKKAGYLHLVN